MSTSWRRERLTLILANRTGQQGRTELTDRLGTDGWAALRGELRRHRVDGVVKFPGHTCVVTATSSASP